MIGEPLLRSPVLVQLKLNLESTSSNEPHLESVVQVLHDEFSDSVDVHVFQVLQFFGSVFGVLGTFLCFLALLLLQKFIQVIV